jgi:RNA polymerase sigma-70 factor (ECF subfamily)
VKAAEDAAPSTGEVEELIRQAKIGDREAFGRLYHTYVPDVYRYVASKVRPSLVEDLVADTFVRALRSIERYEFRGTDLSAWLVRIARNLIYDHVKSHRTTREILQDEIPDAGAEETEPEVMSRLAGESVRRALTRVTVDHRAVLQLRYLDDLTANEAALQMGRSPGAVRILQHRALASLRKEIEAEAPELVPA